MGWYVIFVLAVLILSRTDRAGRTEPQYERFKWVAVALVAINTLVVCLVLPVDRFSVPLQPLVVIVVAQELCVLLERKGGARLRLGALLALLILGGCGFGYDVTRTPKNKTNPVCQRLRAILKPNDVVASDHSYSIALLNDVLAIRLPHHPAELLEISERYVRVDYVVLSPRMLEVKAEERPASYYKSYKEYPEFVESAEFLEKFQLAEELPAGWRLYKNRAPKIPGPPAAAGKRE